jgi:hypothetical protein
MSKPFVGKGTIGRDYAPKQIVYCVHDKGGCYDVFGSCLNVKAKRGVTC